MLGLAIFIAHAGERSTTTTNCAANPPIDAKLQPLQGTWEGVDLGDKAQSKITIAITGHKLHFHRDTNFWFETTIALPAGKDPQQLHATIKNSAPPTNGIGEVVRAIFKIKDGTLMLATGGDGEEGVPKNFEAAEDKGVARYQLRKVQPKKNAQPSQTK